MKDKLILAALVGAFAGAVFLAGYYKGVGSCQSKQTTEIIKEVKHEAQAFANRPKSNCDFVNRVRQWANQRAKDEGGTVQPIPPCPR